MVEEVKQTTKNTKGNVVFIGEKPFMNYVTSIVLQFTTQNSQDVVVKARGKFIAKAVDVCEVARNRFLENSTETKKIDIGSEEFINKEGKQVRVSFIEVTLGKK